ncbi:alpha/beta hydrolase [Longispora sp. K20-0274]|uniref:alpha/beta fold hydrolase n=1 Tax=Longispora sp. K20-0274 TaxID=3088255 RepID=UPI00399A5E04
MTTTKFLDLTDGRLSYDDQGEGPLVLCVPAMIGLRSEFRFTTPLLVAAGFRVVTVDIRGMGESSAAWPAYGSGPTGHDLVALIRHLDAGPALIAGCSSGAGSAVVAAATAPELVSGIALLSPFVRDAKGGLAMTLVRAAARIPGVAGMLWKSHYVQMYPGTKPADFDQERARLAANLAEPGRGLAAKAYICDMSHAEAESLIPRVNAPAVVVMGTADPDFPDPAAEAAWVAEALGADLVMVEGSGHHPHAQAPERVVAAIRKLAGV